MSVSLSEATTVARKVTEEDKNTTIKVDRLVVRSALMDEDASLRKIAQYTQLGISHATVFNRLREAKVKCLTIKKNPVVSTHTV